MDTPKIKPEVLEEMARFFSKTSHPRIIEELKKQDQKIS
jgi:hypothetical protein